MDENIEVECTGKKVQSTDVYFRRRKMIRQSVMLWLVMIVTISSLTFLALSSSPSPTPTPPLAQESQPTVQATTQIFMPAVGAGSQREAPAARPSPMPQTMRLWIRRYGSLILLVLALAALILLQRSKRAS
jgi:hypothetical protein